MGSHLRRLAGTTLAVGLVAPLTCFATNGYFGHGYGTATKGLAGAGTAQPQDALTAATNPAGMAFVGDRADIAVSLFSPRREYTSTGQPSGACDPMGGCTFSVGPQNIESKKDYFVIPHGGYNRMIDAKSSVGISAWGNGGMITKYRGGTATFGTPFGPQTAPGTYGDETAGVDLRQLFIGATYARKVTDNVALGFTPIFAWQRFSARGLRAFGGDFNFDGQPGDAVADGVPDSLSNNGGEDSFGAGARIGILATVHPKVRLGAAVQSKMYMTRFKKYSDLFAEEGKFDVPATASVGAAWDVTDKGTLVADVQWIGYSDIKALNNPFDNFFGCFQGNQNNCLGGDDGPGFGWDDMTIFKVGFEYDVNPTWTWRVGYSYGDQPIPSSETLFNILAPAVIKQHITAGLTYNLEKWGNNQLHVAFAYMPNNSVDGSNPMDPAQNIEIEMDQFDLEVAWSWKF